MTKELPGEITALSFEEALKELESIVHQLESGSASLESSIDLYTRGTELRQLCEAKLKDAEMRIRKITETGAGIKTTPLDVED